ncbi:MAG TPA: hypothetical protein VKB80_24920 [Kofleriaceae bacterium]|nr:hypothetical protein [Kofleriaceae bacterium]
MTALLGLALVACDRGPAAREERAVPKSADRGPAATGAPVAEKPAESEEAGRKAAGTAEPAAGKAEPAAARELALPSGGRVRVALPASWVPRASSIVLENETREAVAGVQFDVVADKATEEDISRFAVVADSTIDGKARPNINTGDPAMDAVRLDVAEVERGKLADGVFRVARVTRPAGLEGPYREELVACCVRGARGQPAVAAQAWAPIAREAELGPVVVAACKGFEILP